MSKFKKGEIAYIFANGWKKVRILRVIGSSYYHVCQIDRDTGFGASEHRLITEADYIANYQTVEEIHRINAIPPLLH